MYVISSYCSMIIILFYIIENLKLKNVNMYLKVCYFKSCLRIFEEVMVIVK